MIVSLESSIDLLVDRGTLSGWLSKIKRGNSGHSLTLTSLLEHKIHNEELAKQWSLTLLSMYYLLQTTRFNGQVENAEVRKPKYGSEKKSRLSVSSALLTHDCTLGKGWTVFKRYENRVLTHWTPACANTVV